MAKFLTTSATNYFLEELLKSANEKLIIISPFLKFNDRIKELLSDKDRMKIDIRIVYGKSELAPQEMNWLKSLEFVRTSFCQHLHAKCYLNEQFAIITSMNLYDFSQINNNEMGVYIDREKEPSLYKETYEEAQRLVRISEHVRLSAEKIDESAESKKVAKPKSNITQKQPDTKNYDKLTISRLSKKLGIKTSDVSKKLIELGYLARNGDQLKITDAGLKIGGEFRFSKKYGPYFLWPYDLKLEKSSQ